MAAASARRAWGASVSRPIVQNLQPESASIVFHTSQSTDIQVEWRALPDGESWRAGKTSRQWLVGPDARAASPLAKLTARIDRLPPGGTIECRALAEGVETGTRWSLRVPSAQAQSCDVLVIGDSGTAGPDQDAILRQMVGGPADLLVHTGDLAYPTSNCSSLRQHYFDPYAGLMERIPFYPVLGNHDTAEDQGAALLGMHDLPAPQDSAWPQDVPASLRGRYYSLVHGPVHFLFLDSNESLLGPEAGNRMLAWLRAELLRSRSFWRVAVFHHTPYPAGIHAGDAMCQLARERILPVLASFEVPLVLCGHEHVYKRTAAPGEGKAGTMVVTTGGGGGSLYPAELAAPNVVARSAFHFVRLRFKGTRLQVQAVDAGGQLLDEVSLAPPPSVRNLAWEPGSAIHVDGHHLALPGNEDGIEVELNGQPMQAARLSANSLELPFSEYAPPSGELRIRTRNGERVIPVQPDQI